MSVTQCSLEYEKYLQMCVRVEKGEWVETKGVVEHEWAEGGGEVVLQVLTHCQVCHYRDPKLRKAGVVIFADLRERG